jgi:hypothetical protein
MFYNKGVNVIWTAVVTGLTIIAFAYGFLWNFKSDISTQISKLENRMNDQLDEYSSVVSFFAEREVTYERAKYEKEKAENKKKKGEKRCPIIH